MNSSRQVVLFDLMNCRRAHVLIINVCMTQNEFLHLFPTGPTLFDQFYFHLTRQSCYCLLLSAYYLSSVENCDRALTAGFSLQSFELDFWLLE